MEPKPIPAFYCCYLLRSKKGRTFYIGSTPNPPRRLAQHNGDTPGGAVKTRRGNNRPWDMTCIVTGFPSNIAALQFEWAWQHFHTTKKITDDERLDRPKKAKSPPPDSKQQKKKPKPPQLTLKTGLSNLHLLLRVPAFSRWPLAVRFLCADVYKAWLKHSKRDPGELREDFQVFRDFEQPAEQAVTAKAAGGPETDKKQKEDFPTMAIAEKIDVTYSKLKPHVAKSIALSAALSTISCSVCIDSVDLDSSTFLTCPSEGCQAVSHMHQWVDLVKELSMRRRGEKHLARLTREPRIRKSKIAVSSASGNDTNANHVPVESLQTLLEDSMHEVDLLTRDPEDDPLPGDWHKLVHEDDNMSVTSTENGLSSRHGSPVIPNKERQKVEVVIEDSEWDSAEVLD
ncbi:MAG: hypothetical protein Q9166_004496 [cf. Caloplaca sp. 2 TL-2023]